MISLSGLVRSWLIVSIMTRLVRLGSWVMSNNIDYDMMGISGLVRSWWIVPIMKWLVRLDSWVMSNHIDYDMISLSGLVRSWQSVPIITWLVILDSLTNVKSYLLWYDELIRSSQIMVNCTTNHGMVVRVVKLGHVKSYWLWHDVLVRSGQFIVNCTNHDIVGHIGQFRSCKIILIITWCISEA